MKTWTRALLLLGAALPLLAWAASAADRPQTRPEASAADDVQDFVFLGEARPVLVRMHVRVDGGSLQAAWDDCIDYLFRYLDVNEDGALSKDELERAPTAAQIAGGGLQGALGGGGGRGGPRPAPTGPTMEALDTDHDGKVSRSELAAYYRKNGFVPFQFNFGTNQAAPLGAYASILGGPKPEPPVESVSKAIFKILDANGDGKLSKTELEAASTVLLPLDEDDDETITTQELVPDAGSNTAGILGMIAMARPGQQQAPTSSSTLVPIAKSGEVPADLVRRMLERYSRGADGDGTKLARKDLGLDEATFRRLDTNADGRLDGPELGAFVKRTPDLELVLRLGKKEASETRLEVLKGEGRSPLAGKLSVNDGLGLLDLGATRAELRSNDQDAPDRLGDLLRQQYIAQFRQADTDGNGTLDADEVKRSRQFNALVKVVDRNSDGKITEEELNAYLDHLQELQKRTTAGCVTLDLSDQSRGLFDLLDVNRDGRLSLREMRQAPKLIDRLGRAGQGFLVREDLPHSYRLEVRRGTASQGGAGGVGALVGRYLTPGYGAEAELPQKGPLWFRKMDRNRDGDVSRREFLFGEELFRKIDTDGDGLISLEEAEKAKELMGKQEKKNP
jgi:Ca2+-binding EF-hand superfamily protein